MSAPRRCRKWKRSLRITLCSMKTAPHPEAANICGTHGEEAFARFVRPISAKRKSPRRTAAYYIIRVGLTEHPRCWIKAPLRLPGRGHGRGCGRQPVVGRAVRFANRTVTGGAFPRKVGGENRTVTAGRRPWWPRMAGLHPLSTRAFGPRLRRLTALTALATRPLIATKRSPARCGQSVCKCHAEKFRSAIFARVLTAVHTNRLVHSKVSKKKLWGGRRGDCIHRR